MMPSGDRLQVNRYLTYLIVMDFTYTFAEKYCSLFTEVQTKFIEDLFPQNLVYGHFYDDPTSFQGLIFWSN